MRLSHSNIAGPRVPDFTTLISIVLLSILLLLLQSSQKHKDASNEMKGVDIELVAEEFVSPIQAVATHNSDRLYIVDQIGKVWVIDGSGIKRPTPFFRPKQ